MNLDTIPFPWIRRELLFDRDIDRGSRGASVERVQEWLTLNNIALVVDGRYGPATEFAVRRFQSRRDLDPTGTVDDATFTELTEPLRLALAPPIRSEGTIEQGVVDAARRHLRQRPREVGGANRGPWVRAYMEGSNGAGYLWCAGFVSFMVRQAAWHAAAPLPLRPTFSCDVLAGDGEREDRFVRSAAVARHRPALDDLPRGSLFVQRRSAGDWNHTGVLIAAMGEVMETIEGNTNEGGSREGVEVCRRIRSLDGKDFVTLQPLRD